MAIDVQILVDERAKLVEDAREAMDTITGDTPEGEAKEIEDRFDAMMVDADKLRDRIERELRLKRAEDSMAERIDFKSEVSGQSREEARQVEINEDQTFDKWLRFGPQGLNIEERQMMYRLAPEQRAQSVGSNTSGGFLVPEGFRNELEEAMLRFGGVRSVATVFPTSTGNALPMPTVNDTDNTGELVSENSTTAKQDVAFGQVTLNAYKFSSKTVLVSWELMQDSAFNLSTYLAGALATRLARVQNAYFTTGTGTGEPNGIVTAATAGNTAAATNAIVASEIVDLIHTVDPDYRVMSRFMFNDSYLKELRKLTISSTDARPLWMPGYVAGEPDTILGYPYVINQQMASGLTTGTIAMVFGDLSKYMIRDVRGVELVRLDELYAANFQTGFVSWDRADGDLLDAGTNPVKTYELN